MASTIKGVDTTAPTLDGSGLRVAIIHARWNKVVIDALVQGALSKLDAAGVKRSNIIVESVPGSFELPLACQKCVCCGTHVYLADDARRVG
jgi:6,7-dimethyl-8-ribityllumazine synthase